MGQKKICYFFIEILNMGQKKIVKKNHRKIKWDKKNRLLKWAKK